MSSNDSLISVCVIVRNEGRRVEEFLERVTQELAAHYQYYELLVLDNASSDGTDQIIAAKLPQIPNVRLLRLARIYNLETAVTAALDASIGDYVILINLETELDVIHRLVEKAQEGHDIVVVRRDLSRFYSPLDRWAGKFLYRIAGRMLGYEVVMEDSFARLFSRVVVNALTQIRSRRRHIRHFGAVIGYRYAYIVSDVGERVPRVNRMDKLSFLINLVVNNSITPLRFAAMLGLFASFLSMLYLIYIVIVTILREGHLAEGWLTSSVSTTTMFFLLFVILAILAEYIGRLLEESKDEPLYFIEYENHSTVSSYTRTMEQEKLNVVQS
jgi:dolichol-phosphate mannosyltransferase